MRVIVVGGAEPAAAIVAALTAEGVEAELLSPHAGSPGRRHNSALAAALVEVEARAATPPDCVVAVGTGDAAIAAALVAAKLAIPLVACPPSSETLGELDHAESRILTLLADQVVEGPGGDRPLSAVAREIAAWTPRSAASASGEGP